MGSRASTLLRDEEIEEIKKETGCEYRLETMSGGNVVRDRALTFAFGILAGRISFPYLAE